MQGVRLDSMYWCLENQDSTVLFVCFQNENGLSFIFPYLKLESS